MYYALYNPSFYNMVFAVITNNNYYYNIYAW